MCPPVGSVAVADDPAGGVAPGGGGFETLADPLAALLLSLEALGESCHRHLAGGVVLGELVGDEHWVSVVDSVIIEGQGSWQLPGRTLFIVAQRVAVASLIWATVKRAPSTTTRPTPTDRPENSR